MGNTVWVSSTILTIVTLGAVCPKYQYAKQFTKGLATEISMAGWVGACAMDYRLEVCNSFLSTESTSEQFNMKFCPSCLMQLSSQALQLLSLIGFGCLELNTVYLAAVFFSEAND